jgi:rod shape-determining protein MreC
MKLYCRKKGSYFIYFIILILVVILANIFSSGLRNLTYTVSRPFQQFFWSAGLSVSNLFGGVASIGTAKNEINALKQQNGELQTQLILLKETQDQNEFLKEALSLELNKKYELVLAKFISKDVNSDVVSLNKGTNDGIQVGMPIITSGGIVAGKIKEAYPTYSKASLLSTDKLTFDVRIKHDDQSFSAVAEGKGNNCLTISLIARDANIIDGDVVITDSLGNIFPESLGVGKIKKISKSDVSPFQNAEIEQFFSIINALDIFIVKRAK